MPTISIVMPVYNAEKFLREAIESILNQSCTDFELIIVDDGSIDHSPKILQSYHDPRIVLITNEANSGIVESLNRGIKKAHGRYICRMDADDVSLPERLETQLEFMEIHPEVAVLGTNTIMIDERGDTVGTESYPVTHREIMKTIFIHNPFAHGTVMMRMEILRECGMYDKRFLHNEDFDLWLRIARKYQVANLPLPSVKRRIHHESITFARETELVRYRINTLAHAIFHYYGKPQYGIFLIRPVLAYLYRRLRKSVR